MVLLSWVLQIKVSFIGNQKAERWREKNHAIICISIIPCWLELVGRKEATVMVLAHLRSKLWLLHAKLSYLPCLLILPVMDTPGAHLNCVTRRRMQMPFNAFTRLLALSLHFLMRFNFMLVHIDSVPLVSWEESLRFFLTGMVANYCNLLIFIVSVLVIVGCWINGEEGHSWRSFRCEICPQALVHKTGNVIALWIYLFGLELAICSLLLWIVSEEEGRHSPEMVKGNISISLENRLLDD